MTLLVAVPAMTAVLAGFVYVQTAEEEWETTGELSLREFSAGQSAAEIRVTNSNFETALGSRRVAEKIAQVRGVDPATSFVEVQSLGDGGDVQVALTAPSPALSERALDVGVREALTVVAESERRRISRQLVAADAVAEESIATLLEVEQQAGASSLEDEVARRSGDLLTLRNQIAAAEGAGTQQALERTLLEKQEELIVIEQQLLRWTNIRERLNVAVASGADASLRLQQITTGLSDLEAQPVLDSVRTNPISELPGLMRVVVAAAAGAGIVIVAVALFAGMGRRPETLSSQPQGPRRHPETMPLKEDSRAGVS